MNRFSAESKPSLSVVLCSHNPRADYLSRTLDALRRQSLPCAAWELLLIDNASDAPLAGRFDLSWHPHGRVVREETLGLTPARLRGFRESHGDLIVMVDDDNLLAPDYLEVALKLAAACPFLGVFGGSLDPEFEQPPPEWTRPYWGCIAIRPVQRSVWSNDIDHWESTPSGAGMCVRRDVAERYARDMEMNPLRKALDRTGQSLVSGGDLDLAWTACAMGAGMGQFGELKLKHLIPPERLTEEYLCRMHEGKGYTGVILGNLWGRRDPEAVYEGFWNLLRMGWRRFRADWKGRRFLAAKRNGEARARQQLRQISSVPAQPKND
jgi:glycosyltransferase involved in cell wall biosynthesis